MGTPIGSYLFLFAVIRFISLKIKEKFSVELFFENMVAATFLILVFYLLNNLFIFIYYSQFILSEYFLLNIISTIFIYPAFAVFFNWIRKATSIEKYYAKT